VTREQLVKLRCELKSAWDLCNQARGVAAKLERQANGVSRRFHEAKDKFFKDIDDEVCGPREAGQ
jgi:hypothetical protein